MENKDLLQDTLDRMRSMLAKLDALLKDKK